MTPPIAPRRRADDGPMWPRLVLAFAIFACGVGLRVAGMVGEPVLVVFIFAAGVLVKDESVLTLARIWRRNPTP